MKRVLTVYWNYTRGIRTFGFLTIALYAAAMIFRDIFRPFVLKNLVDGLSTHAHDVSYLWYQVFLFAVMHIMAQICFRSAEFVNSTFEAKHMRNLRNLAFEHMIKHSFAFFAGNYAGSLVTKQKRFVHSAELLFDELVGSGLSTVIQVVGVTIVMYFVSVPMMLGILVWVGFYIANVTFMAKKRLKLDYKEAEEDSKVTGAFADVISNISITKSFGSSDREKKRFYDVTNNHYIALLNAWRFANKQSVMQGIFSTLIHVGAIAAGLSLWISHKLTAGDLILIAIYAGQLSGCLWDFGRTIRKYSRAIADAGEMVEIIDQKPGIQDNPDALKHVSLLPEEATIDFKNVSFAYNKSAQIFEDFNLHIPAGEKVAIIGSTGAGKTTLVSLLLRTVDAQQGAVCIGPYDIKEMVTQDGFKPCIGSVSQNIELFNRSIGDNIGYGNPAATLEDIMASAKKAYIHDFIDSLPEKYNTMVGERGVKLSGGQRQRVGIARALLHDAPILVFDEATSSLDNITEKEIQRILETGLRGKTVIVIAHRLSTIRNCDRIIVMEHGKIVQDGNHDQLVSDSEGIYYQLLHSHDIAVKEGVYE